MPSDCIRPDIFDPQSFTTFPHKSVTVFTIFPRVFALSLTAGRECSCFSSWNSRIYWRNSCMKPILHTLKSCKILTSLDLSIFDSLPQISSLYSQKWIHISNLQLNLLYVLKRNFLMTWKSWWNVIHMQLTCNLLSSVYCNFTSIWKFSQGLTSMTTNLPLSKLSTNNLFL